MHRRRSRLRGVLVAAGAWDYRGSTAEMPVAFTGDGTLVAAGLVFAGIDAPTIGVAAARHAPGGPWISEGALKGCGEALPRCVAMQPAGFGSAGPALAVNDAGRGALVWSAGPSEELGELDRPGLFASVRSPSGAWGRAHRISEMGGGWRGLAAAVDASGNASVASSVQGGGPIQLARRGAKGAKWVREAFDGATSAVHLGSGRNRIVAGWADHDAVTVRLSPAGGAWQATSIPGGAGADRVIVEIDDQGTAHAVWRRESGAGAVIEHAVRPPGDAWSAPAPLVAGLPPGLFASDLDLEIDGDGDLVVAWTDGAEVWLRRRDDKGSWSAPEVLARSADATVYWNVDLAGDRRRDMLLTFNGYVDRVAPGVARVHDSMWASIWDG